MMKKFNLLLISVLSGMAVLSQQNDTLSFFFDVNKSNLDKQQLMSKLDQLGLSQAFFSAHTVDLVIKAYTDCTGSKAHNIELSKKRAKAIEVLFSDTYFPYLRIIESNGLGELECGELSSNDDKKKRRADVIINSSIIEEEMQESSMDELEHLPQVPIIKMTEGLEAIRHLDIGETMLIRGLNFIGGRHTPTRAALPRLKELLKIMKDNPTLEIEIQGHICCVLPTAGDGEDSDAHGEKFLSRNRAKYVYDYLISNEIASERLSYIGFAGSRPLVQHEKTDNDASKNRRVEIMIVKK